MDAPPPPRPWPLTTTVAGVQVPTLLYGTAWKEERTAALTLQALRAGFRGIDSANQRRHYHEAGVGEALRKAAEGGIPRDALFLQTKFTFRQGQDHRLPYDADAPVARQVAQSFASSLEHLGTDHLDAYVLHGPSTGHGLTDEDWEAWAAMEALQRAGKVRLLGISNAAPDQLRALHEGASVEPAIVQNRCFTRPHADRPVRAFCREHGIAYQGFSLLTGHPRLLHHPRVAQVAARLGATPAQVVLRHCLDEGMVVLTGTTSPLHLAQDLAIHALRLQAGEARDLAATAG